MASSPPSLPFVDISPFLNPNPTTQSLAPCITTLREACSEHGFFYLTNHGIPPALTARVLSLARDFFTKCSQDEKAIIARRDAGDGHGDGARGYQVTGSNVTSGKRDWHEGIDFYRPIYKEEALHGAEWKDLRDQDSNYGFGSKNESNQQHQPPFELLHGKNLWPDSPSDFKPLYERYVEQMLALGTVVVRAMGHALELEDPETFVKATRESFWVMRAIGYPPLPSSSLNDADSDVDAVSCGAHTDYGCVTLLLADATTGALQVQSRTQPDVWINADPVEGAFVVNIGDMIERWTNGRWKSTLHRVVHRGNGYRVSVPFFFEPDWEARVRPLGECVGVDGVERFEEVGYGEHLVGKVKGNFYGVV